MVQNEREVKGRALGLSHIEQEHTQTRRAQHEVTRREIHGDSLHSTVVIEKATTPRTTGE